MTESVALASAIALAVSIVWALANHILHIALQHMSVRGGTIVIVATAFLVLLALAPLYLEPAGLQSAAVGWFALAGLIVPSLSMTLHTKSVGQIGPALTAALTSTAPVFAITIAVLLLGERGGINLYLGTAIIIASVAFMGLHSRSSHTTWPLWALLVPLGAALTRAASHNAVKVGLNDLPDPMTAALVGSTVSLLVLGAWQLASGRRMPAWNPGYWWFGLCGLLNGIGLVGLNLALELGTVSIVSPLVSTTPAFTLILGWLFFRKEIVRSSTVFAMAAIFVGCLLIILR